MNKNDTQISGYQFSSSTRYLNIISLTDIVNMGRNRGISTDTVVFHKTDKLRLCKVIRWTSFTLRQTYSSDRKNLSLLEVGDVFIRLGDPKSKSLLTGMKLE